MVDFSSRSDASPKPHFLFIGNFLAVAYWISEAYFDSLLIENTTFAMRLFPSDSHELWMRSFICLLFVGFGLYAHRTFARIRKTEKLNVDAAWLLKNALSNTIRGRFPICANCKRIYDEENHWVEPDRFISDHTEARFLRIVCDKCQVESS